jgi:hypothetical protein
LQASTKSQPTVGTAVWAFQGATDGHGQHFDAGQVFQDCFDIKQAK